MTTLIPRPRPSAASSTRPRSQSGSRHVAKTLSWAAVSFVLILGIEMATHWLRHGSAGFGEFLQTAGIGVLIACIIKTPVYLAHEVAWHPKISQHRLDN